MIYGSVSNKKVSKADLINAKDACGVSLLAWIVPLSFEKKKHEHEDEVKCE
jgi:hypothetical protein